MKKLLFFILIAFLTSSCATIPKNASILSASVTDGIERLQEQCEIIIKTLGDVERGVLDDKYEDIYYKCEVKYREANKIADDQTLTRDQYIDITTIIISVREEILNEITLKEQTLIAASRKNSKQVININNEVQDYILSLEKYNQSTTNISNLAKEIIGLDPKIILGTVNSDINKIITKSFN